MRLTVGHLKGGTGKTTTAVHLALGLARQGRTLLVDADPDQDGALAWSQEAADWRQIAASSSRPPTGTWPASSVRC